jgi:fatty-acyl-CoA synthase
VPTTSRRRRNGLAADVVDAIAAHARTRPTALACADLETGRRWSYREFDVAIDRTAAWLVEQLGPASGARVAVLAKNSADALIVHYACIRAGAIYVPFNWRLAPPEIAALLADAAPSMLFRDPEFAATEFSDPTFALTDLTALTASALTDSPPPEARRDFEAPVTLLYTSGTSGTPKGVTVSESNAFFGATNFSLGNHIDIHSVFLCDMPMFHTAGLFAACRVPLLAGGSVLISKGFDPPVTLRRICDPALKITHYFCAPQMAQVLWNQPDFDPSMLRGLKALMTGGAPNPTAQIERFVDAGIAMSDGFGMSETGSNFGMPLTDLDIVRAKAGSCGRPYLTIEARIVDHTGHDVPVGTAGELWLRGPSVTSGYWNRPDLAAAAFEDGWFKTGDVAKCDSDGFYFLVDRMKDMYISGGENVYPAEVEAVIAELPEVAECAVIGVADERWGEVGNAYVLAAVGHTVSAQMIVAHCATRLAKFKVPAVVITDRAIPRTSSGKVQKHLLRGT